MSCQLNNPIANFNVLKPLLVTVPYVLYVYIVYRKYDAPAIGSHLNETANLSNVLIFFLDSISY